MIQVPAAGTGILNSWYTFWFNVSNTLWTLNLNFGFRPEIESILDFGGKNLDFGFRFEIDLQALKFSILDFGTTKRGNRGRDVYILVKFSISSVSKFSISISEIYDEYDGFDIGEDYYKYDVDYYDRRDDKKCDYRNDGDILG